MYNTYDSTNGRIALAYLALPLLLIPLFLFLSPPEAEQAHIQAAFSAGSKAQGAAFDRALAQAQEISVDRARAIRAATFDRLATAARGIRMPSLSVPAPVVTVQGKEAQPTPQPVAVSSDSLQPGSDTETILFRAADEFKVPRKLARAMVGQESGGDPNSTSPKGARGLLQVMPATGRGIAQELGVEGYSDAMLYDPEVCARFGMYYIAKKIERYGGVTLGLAAYNWGPGSLDAFLERHPEAQGMAWADIVARWGGEIPGETRSYVQIIESAYYS